MRVTRIVLAVLVLCFLGLAFLYVPRLVNCLWSDGEFTGWVSPIAERMVAGERIYRDFTMPISPGSFLVLAAIQRVLGRALLLDELWVCTLCQLGMVLIGYWLVRQFTSPRIALLAAMCTAPILTATPKEIAYDQTTHLVAWGSLALLARGLFEAEDRRRYRWLALAGFVSALTIAFKSSTGLGAVGGAVLGLVSLTALAWWRDRLAGLRNFARHWIALLGGLAAGIVATAGIVVAAGGHLPEFIQTVFIDGPALKGGTKRAFGNLISFTVFQTPVTITLLTALLLAYLFARVMGRRNVLQVATAAAGQPPEHRAQPTARFAALACLLLLLTYGSGMVFLLTNAESVPLFLRVLSEFGLVPRMGSLLFLVVFLVASLRSASRVADRRAIFGALAIAAGVQSLMHNLSWPDVRPFYDNNPVIPLGIGALLTFLDRARAHLVKWGAVVLLLASLYSPKFQRYLDARLPVADAGFWRGLKVSGNGQTILRAALRARELAGPDGTVLMLPEDPKIGALIGRPRPKLFGAIVFVDQYPAHALARDLAVLHADPPKVVLLHPRSTANWESLYHRWRRTSPAATLQEEFVKKRLDSLYRLDSSYPTWFYTRASTLDIFVRTP